MYILESNNPQWRQLQVPFADLDRLGFKGIYLAKAHDQKQMVDKC